MRARMRLVVLVVMGSIVASVPVAAQSIVRGKVLDADGTPVADATVTIEGTAANRRAETKTNRNGEFLQVGLPPGRYNVTVTTDNAKRTLPANVTQGLPTELTFQLAATDGPSPELLAKLAEARKNWLAEVEKTRAAERSPEVIAEGKSAAIDMVRNARTLNSVVPNELQIRRHLQALKGDLRITGWEAELPLAVRFGGQPIDGNWVFLVQYLFSWNGERHGWSFEANLRAGIVRPVAGDAVLEKKMRQEYYGRRRWPKLP